MSNIVWLIGAFIVIAVIVLVPINIRLWSANKKYKSRKLLRMTETDQDRATRQSGEVDRSKGTDRKNSELETKSVTEPSMESHSPQQQPSLAEQSHPAWHTYRPVAESTRIVWIERLEKMQRLPELLAWVLFDEGVPVLGMRREQQSLLDVLSNVHQSLTAAEKELALQPLRTGELSADRGKVLFCFEGSQWLVAFVDRKTDSASFFALCDAR